MHRFLVMLGILFIFESCKDAKYNEPNNYVQTEQKNQIDEEENVLVEEEENISENEMQETESYIDSVETDTVSYGDE